MGYKIFSQVLNAKDFGVPQNRERIYIIGFLDSGVAFEFPEKEELGISIENCLEEKVEEKYYYKNTVLFEKLKDEVVCQKTVYQWRRQYVRANKSKVCPTLTANMGTGGHNVPLVIDDIGIRKLTPRECLNFQGFPSSFNFPNIVNSQLYKQAGNSVSVPVVEKIARVVKSLIKR